VRYSKHSTRQCTPARSRLHQTEKKRKRRRLEKKRGGKGSGAQLTNVLQLGGEPVLCRALYAYREQGK